jgi:hypothetical protein
LADETAKRKHKLQATMKRLISASLLLSRRFTHHVIPRILFATLFKMVKIKPYLLATRYLLQVFRRRRSQLQLQPGIDPTSASGCGRFFEGTAEQMHQALNNTLAALPDDAKIYPGHEYTKSNIAFGQSVLGDVPPVKNLVQFCEDNKETQGKFTIGDEKVSSSFDFSDECPVSCAALKSYDEFRDTTFS